MRLPAVVRCALRTLTGRLKGKPCAECSQLIVLGAKVEVDDSEDPPPGVRPFLLMMLRCVCRWRCTQLLSTDFRTRTLLLRRWAQTALALAEAETLYDVPQGAAAMQAVLSGVCDCQVHTLSCLPAWKWASRPRPATAAAAAGKERSAAAATTDGEVEGCRCWQWRRRRQGRMPALPPDCAAGRRMCQAGLQGKAWRGTSED